MTRSPDPVLELSAEERAAIVKRLRRAQGQVGGIARMVEENRDCRDVIAQLTAARTALDRAGFALINGALRHCLTAGGTPDEERLKALERLFLRLG